MSDYKHKTKLFPKFEIFTEVEFFQERKPQSFEITFHVIQVRTGWNIALFFLRIKLFEKTPWFVIIRIRCAAEILQQTGFSYELRFSEKKSSAMYKTVGFILRNVVRMLQQKKKWQDSLINNWLTLNNC